MYDRDCSHIFSIATFYKTAPLEISIPIQPIPWIALIFQSMRPILLEAGLPQPFGVCTRFIFSLQLPTYIAGAFTGVFIFWIVSLVSQREKRNVVVVGTICVM